MFKFENEHFERLLVEFQSLKYDIHRLTQLGTQLMATLSDVQAAQATETAAITALAARIVPPAATAADLDGIVATATANTAAINAIDPTAAPAS